MDSNAAQDLLDAHYPEASAVPAVVLANASRLDDVVAAAHVPGVTKATPYVDPVTGKKVHATFSGPTTAPALDAVENTAELGPGRYRFTVPGLDAGSWKVTISVSDAGSGVYDLEVTR